MVADPSDVTSPVGKTHPFANHSRIAGNFLWRGEDIIEGLGSQLGWSLKLINLRRRLCTNFFNIMLKKLVLSLIL